MQAVIENADQTFIILILKILFVIIATFGIPFILFTLQGNFFSKFSFKNLKYKCEFSSEEAYEGDEISLIETVENMKHLPVLWLKVDLFTSTWLDFPEAATVVAQDSRYITSRFKLKGHQKVTRTWKIKCNKRGFFNISEVSLSSGDITKIYKSFKHCDVNTSLIVYPAITDTDKIYFHNKIMQGDVVVKRWFLDDPFMISGVREYTQSDSMNKLHWNATAKTGQLMVKKNEYTSRPGLTVILNIQSQYREFYETMNKKLVEYGIKIAATILDKALEQGVPVRFATNGSTPEASGNGIFTSEAAGREHTREILGVLSRLELKKSCYFEDFMSRISPNIESCDIIIITAYITDEAYKLIKELSCKESHVKVIALQPLEPVYANKLDIYLPLKEGEVSA